jgi:hypothetical protein
MEISWYRSRGASSASWPGLALLPGFQSRPMRGHYRLGGP